MKRLRGRSNSAEWSSKKGTLDVPFLHDAASAGQPNWRQSTDVVGVSSRNPAWATALYDA